MARLAMALVGHQLRRMFRSAGRHSGTRNIVESYRADHLSPLTVSERSLLHSISRCIGCGLCGLAISDGKAPELGQAYSRPLHLLPSVIHDLDLGEMGEAMDLAAGGSACPVGVPLIELAAMLQRLGGRP
jgi:hypothetical protein